MIIGDFKQLLPFRHKQGIYLFTNKKDPSKKYCGKATNLYKRIVLEHAKGYDNNYIDNTIRQHGLLEYFIVELIHWWDEKVDNLTVLALEVACIDDYNCLKEKGGYNILLFNFDRTGYRHTNEEKLAQSIKMSGPKNPNFGKHFSKETKLKMAASKRELYKNGYINPNKGKPKSEKAKYNMRKAWEWRRINGIKRKSVPRSLTTKYKIAKSRHNKYSGINHPFFGKHHTKETCRKISNSLNNKYINGYINPLKGIPKSKKSIQLRKENVIKNKTYKGKNNPRFDKKNYRFKHLITNEIFEGVQYDFRMKYNLPSSSVTNMINGTYKSTQNWILIS